MEDHYTVMDALTQMHEALQQTKAELTEMAWKAGDDDLWNIGGSGYELLQKVKSAIHAFEQV